MIKTHMALEGVLRLELFDGNGNLKIDTGEFNNLITNSGLDLFYTKKAGRLFSYTCSIGSDDTTPSVTDTGPGSVLATKPKSSADLVSKLGDVNDLVSDPLRVEIENKYTFNAGEGTGTIAEICIGDNSGTPVNFSRALVQVNGSPGTIVKTAEDILIVTYTLKVYVDTSGTPHDVYDDGPGGTKHECVVLPVRHSGAIQGGSNYFFSVSVRGTSYVGNRAMQAMNGSSYSGLAYTSMPTLSPYIPGAHEIEYIYSLSSGQGNVVGGISYFYGSTSDNAAIQATFDPPIPKTSQETLELRFKRSWGRK